MGIFNASIEIGNPAGSRFETISALVDTGASFTTLPGPFLYSLGVTPHDQFTFTMADRSGKSGGMWDGPGYASATGRSSLWWCSATKVLSLC